VSCENESIPRRRKIFLTAPPHHARRGRADLDINFAGTFNIRRNRTGRLDFACRLDGRRDGAAPTTNSHQWSRKMIIKLKSLPLFTVLGLALLVGSFALASSPVRADDTETTSASQPIETTSVTPAPELSDSATIAERLETCVSEERPIESCIVRAQTLAENQAPEADQQPSAVAEISSPIEVDLPLAQTGAAIIMEITQSVTIAVPGEALPEQANDQDEPVYTGSVTTEASLTEVKTETPEVESSAPQATAPTSESSDVPAEAPPAPAIEE
jgi:hypothetical protein